MRITKKVEFDSDEMKAIQKAALIAETIKEIGEPKIGYEYVVSLSSYDATVEEKEIYVDPEVPVIACTTDDKDLPF